ncbi:hypothetical protein EVAR_96507_1, partial [Eumeta japonica]
VSIVVQSFTTEIPTRMLCIIVDCRLGAVVQGSAVLQWCRLNTACSCILILFLIISGSGDQLGGSNLDQLNRSGPLERGSFTTLPWSQSFPSQPEIHRRCQWIHHHLPRPSRPALGVVVKWWVAAPSEPEKLDDPEKLRRSLTSRSGPDLKIYPRPEAVP